MFNSYLKINTLFYRHFTCIFPLFFSFRLLSTAQGSLLDDEQLVNTLHTSKITSTEVSEQLQTSEQTEIKIDTAREVSRCVIKDGSRNEDCCMLEIFIVLIRYFSNYYTLHRIDATATPLVPRLIIIYIIFDIFLR